MGGGKFANIRVKPIRRGKMGFMKSKKFWAVSIITVLLVSFMFLATACCGTSTTNVSTYAEFVDALKGTSEVIKLEKDIVIDSTLVVEREVILDMNGKTISNEVDVWNVEENNWSVISVRAGGDLTIKGDGKIQAKENDAYGIDVMDGGNLVIESVEVVGNIHAVYVYEGSAEIKGGKYSVQQKYSADPATANEYVLNLDDAHREAGTASIVVTGGTFVEFNPQNCKAEGDKTNFVKGGYVATLDETASVPTYVVSAE